MFARKNALAYQPYESVTNNKESVITLTTGEGLETGHHHEEAGRGSGIIFNFIQNLPNGLKRFDRDNSLACWNSFQVTKSVG